MEEKKFNSMLILIVPEVMKLIVENHGIDEIDASDRFYSSKVYEKLEQEETKLWHLSPLTLFNMYDTEQKTGEVIYPEEV